MCSRTPKRKPCLHGAHIITGCGVGWEGAEANKLGKYMACQVVVSVVEKENVGNEEQRMLASMGGRVSVEQNP